MGPVLMGQLPIALETPIVRAVGLSGVRLWALQRILQQSHLKSFFIDSQSGGLRAISARDDGDLCCCLTAS